MGLQGQQIIPCNHRWRRYCWSYCCHRYASSLLPAVVVAYRISGLRRAGHDVLILEQVPHLREIGAGIQVAPNAARILGRFGLLGELMECANVLESTSSRRWQTDEEIGTTLLMPKVQSLYYYTRNEC